MKLVLSATAVLLVLLGGTDAAYRKYWENRSLPNVPDERCGVKKGETKDWGKDYPNAIACSDEMGTESCLRFAEGGAAATAVYTPGNQKRNDLCHEPYFQQAANRCRRTCGTCCEHDSYKCEDTVKDKPNFTCASISGNKPKNAAAGASTTPIPNLCSVKAFKDLLVDACAASCGYCDLKALKDKEPKMSPGSGSSGGQRPKKPPISPEKLKIPVVDKCRDSPPKGSKEGYCKRRMYRCEEGKHVEEMKRHCKKTCAICLPKKYECKDNTDKAKCARWKTRGFCLNGDYPLSAKLHHCAATCEMCKA